MKDLNKLSKEIHENNKRVGWWNLDKEGNGPCIFEKLQLVSTEIAEATEGERKGLMDDHLPHRKMAEVELADALIRTLDVGGMFGFIFIEGLYCDSWVSVVSSIAKRHLGINRALINLANKIDGEISDKNYNQSYSVLINSILVTSILGGYNIYGAMEEKLQYNKERPDHKLENREKVNGKKF